jgi:hypothetical protein
MAQCPIVAEYPALIRITQRKNIRIEISRGKANPPDTLRLELHLPVTLVLMVTKVRAKTRR